MNNLIIPKLTMNTTTDPELVQLAGLHAYLEHRELNRIEINKSEFLVYHTNYNHPTGLDALTLQNVSTGEFIMAFVGTNVHAEHGMQDLKTNVRLLNEPTSPLLTIPKFLNHRQFYGLF
ncbi:hypothetical protein N7Z68_12685 [Alkalihalobacillus sp. MEB203]|uniref:Uncharacterized protein n=1 Tax=Alkalihalobacterium chitinilyticum TaxID=2980103 RepID=A0ABT5VFJ3_9BACI|nr:hypothetical protein [Alkalihalobacterium chitinilyticum]MDE5414230.1 hypothetical protein [Alkalihalobacterium chitinilyticum]